jgi:hypothetical protein
MQGVRRGGQSARDDRRAAATLDDRVHRVGPEHGHGRERGWIEGERLVLVPQQHEGCGRGPAQQGGPYRGRSGPVSAPTRRASRSSRSTLSSISSLAMAPLRTASIRAAPQGPRGPGMARSSPARAVGTVLRAALQSDTTTVKPHSPFRTSRNRPWCSVISAPFTEL